MSVSNVYLTGVLETCVELCGTLYTLVNKKGFRFCINIMILIFFYQCESRDQQSFESSISPLFNQLSL